MEDNARIRINLNSREVEIEGSEDFISKYSNVIDEYLFLLKNSGAPAKPERKDSEESSGDTTSPKIEDNKPINDIPESFGEFYNTLPRSAKDVDKILAAGYFIQKTNDKGVFSTRNSSKLLIEQGVKLSNASASLKSNLSTKKVFKHLGDYKVSEAGIQYLKKLMLRED